MRPSRIKNTYNMETDEMFYGVTIVIEKSLCIGCGACLTVCAPRILEIDKTTKKIRITNSDLCTGCAECIDSCFEEALKLITTKGEKV